MRRDKEREREKKKTLIWRRFENGQLHFEPGWIWSFTFDSDRIIPCGMRILYTNTPFIAPSLRKVERVRRRDGRENQHNNKLQSSWHRTNEVRVCTICITRTNLWIETISDWRSSKQSQVWANQPTSQWVRQPARMSATSSVWERKKTHTAIKPNRTESSKDRKERKKSAK